MRENKVMQQVSAIFSLFMVLFYTGVGLYFIFFFENTYLDKAVRVILGSTFLMYGIYRAFRAYYAITEAFFRKEHRDRDFSGRKQL